ncbi:MAG TPA: ABC transporter ATP-binding protein [Longimicrobiales bacterium]|nr:ABC transporter ATP-binding protein [Longimicrobiales bacterium]
MTGATAAFESVSKRFYRGRRHGTLRDLLWPFSARGAGRDPFWALRDVSFSVGPGQAFGIIGPNGSGKSTVLRLLAGILRPESGRVVVRGPSGRRPRIGALIELAAGFHYELTGRENVYLQGAVLGMRRAEIAGKFDEIVEFAELATFIDTPVKHYSSGMNARLGFSIAAHLDPDVLVIDEVLAVGDDAFQRKAFARLAQAVRGEVPAIVVSHQLHRVIELCDSAMLLDHGRVAATGTAAECVRAYVGSADGPAPSEASPSPIRLTGVSEPDPAAVEPGERVRVRVRGVVADGTGEPATVGVRVRSLPREDLVFVAHSAACGVGLPGSGPFELEIDVRMNVAPGTYRVQPVVWSVRGGRELARGDATLVVVGGASAANGRVFADPKIRLLSS